MSVKKSLWQADARPRVKLRDGRTLVADVADNRLSVFVDAAGDAEADAITWIDWSTLNPTKP